MVNFRYGQISPDSSDISYIQLYEFKNKNTCNKVKEN